MKSVWKHVLVPLAAVLMASSGAFAQTATSSGGSGGGGVNPDGINFNHGPCDFSNVFYAGDGTAQNPGNGINVTVLDNAAQQRFGIFRQFGPPATGSQKNWVTDATCSTNDPTRNNVRILATTGGYPDLGVTFGTTQVQGSSSEFISIIAFLTDPTVFTGANNARNITMPSIVSNFEAYAGLKQIVNGTFQTQPCGSMGPNGSPPLPNPPATNLTTNCFPVTSEATPQLRQDWRFATNRNAIDGSDNNDPFNVLGVATGNPSPPPGIPFDPTGATTNNSPFGYFCDDLIGIWIVTYFWLPINPNTVDPTSACGIQYAALIAANGKSLDGSPIMKSGDDLNGTEAITQDKGPQAGFPCAQEGKLAMDGSDGGAIWIVCPTIQDPRNGSITPDAFLDQVHLPNGQPLDPEFNANFNCLQQKGQYPTITAGSSGSGTHSTASNGSPITVVCQGGTGSL